ncbi:MULTISPECIES: ExeA family protein [unclassified Ketobacter]|uniref:ExeA family protein n=1 Tax=unclassified Ketobacter TaxID=2639109 RepID=UPI000F2D55D4|nr:MULTISPECIES: AAA family ATPase [unclassified Ketobacter]RLT90121.1 MAG: AAA family ATPase [Ketobacter sp. GenoA1]RLT99132.1 MAG: AAA family ATPase [Ketobacter sp.]
MYEAFFHLQETPFSIAPNPHYLYMSQQHNEALAHLVYGVGRDGGFVLLTGEVGTGKTTVCRCFLEQIPDDTDVAFVLNPKLQVEELLATICDELSIPYIGDSISVKDYIDCINGFLLRQHAQGRHTVLIIDEAQNLNSDVLEQIRLLTNLETHEKKLLQIILLGQPELQEMFRQPELRQLSQRVTARFHLNALGEDEVGPYVYHRLTVAGAVDPKAMFPVATIRKLYQISKGIPRIINLVCDRAMLGAYAKETRVIDGHILGNAAKEVLGYKVYAPAKSTRQKWLPALIGGAAGFAIMVLVGLSYWMGVSQHEAPHAVAEEADSNAAEPVADIAAAAAKEPPPPPAILKQANIKSATEVVPEAAAQQSSLLSLDQVFELADHQQDADAYRDLFSAWGIPYDPAENGMACPYAESLGLACLSKLGSLGSIKHYGMPVIVRLFGPAGDEKFIVIRRLDDGVAEVYLGGEIKRVDIRDLDAYWRGHYSLLWKKPPSYHGPMHPGTIAPLSKWLSYQLDVWENKPQPSAGRSTYDTDLVERVKQFQRTVGEIDDGVVGSGTLIQLSRRVDETIPRLDPIEGGS